MKDDMRNLLVSIIFLSMTFLVIGMGIGNRMRIENDIYLFPLSILFILGFLYSTSKFMKK